MKKFNITTAALLLSIASSCVTAAAAAGSHHHGDPVLAAFFENETLPRNAVLARDSSFRGIDHYTKVAGVQVPTSRLTLFPTTLISVRNVDTLAAVTEMLRDGISSPVILNLANKTIAGGGVRNGAKAQEEDLCRTTTLYSSLMAADRARAYPLGTFEAIYSPKVWSHGTITPGTVPAADAAAAMAATKPESFACITMAGYRVKGGPRDLADYPGTADFAKGMEEKVKVILSTAITKGHTNIVLGAIGCGAFARDASGKIVAHIPVDVAKAFNAVLTAPYVDGVPFVSHFGKIVFAILEDPRNALLIPTFTKALGITHGDSKTSTLALTIPRGAPAPASAASAAAGSSHADVNDEVTPAAAAAATAAPTFDVRTTNLDKLLKEASKLPSSVFTGTSVTSTVLKSTPWTGPKAPWPTMVKSYTETAGSWEIMCSFAHSGFVFDVKITGDWKSLSKDARAWLKKVTKK